jgi:serine/threonine-protein kinase
VLWEMLTGRRLFRADNEAKLLALVLDGDVHPPSVLVDGLAEGFDRVVMRGIDRDPAKRYATAREMAIDVESVVGIAPPSEVGEWVEVLAADELRERTSRIEEIERSVRNVPSSPSGAWPGSLTASGVSRRNDEAQTVNQGGRSSSAAALVPGFSGERPKPPEPSQPTVRHGLGRTGSGAPVAPGSSGERLKPPPHTSQVVSQVSQVSHLSVSHTDRPGGSTKRSSGLLVAAAVALFAAGGTMLALRPSHSRAAATVAASQVPSATVPTAKAQQAPAPSTSWTTAPSAPPSASTPKTPAFALEDLPPQPKPHPRPQGLSPASQTPPQTPVQQVTQPPPAVEARGLEHPPNKRPPPAAECNPPYTTDEKGHIHFKPACLN